MKTEAENTVPIIADEAAAFKTSSDDGFMPDEWAMFSIAPRKSLPSGLFVAMIGAASLITFNVPTTLCYSRRKKYLIVLPLLLHYK